MYARRAVRLRILVIACLCASATIASAETDVEKADRLFQEGREHLKNSKYAQACDAFEESQRLDPQLGVLFNLASCREKTGKLATALELYRELARTDTNEERRKAAEGFAASIGPRVPKLVVKVDAAPALSIAIDGKDMSPMRGLGVPVDLGKHVVIVRATGFQDYTREVIVREEKKVIEVPVTLSPVGAAAQGPLPALDQAQPPPETTARPTSSKVRYGKIAVIGGGALTAIGLGFGAAALVKWNGAKDEMPTNDTEYRDVADRIDRARLFGNISTVTVIVGLVGAGVGGYLWYSGSKSTTIVPSAEASGGGVTVVHRF